MFKKLALAGALLALGLTAAVAGGMFPGYPNAANPLTGNETIPADTNLAGGASPQTELITPGQIASYVGSNSLTQYKNSLICGDFGTCPWQRGTGTSADIANTLTYWADRWFNLGAAGSAIDVSKQTGATDIITGQFASLRFQRKSANTDVNAICMGQVLETTNSIKYQGATAILSFTAKAGANFSAASNNLNVTIAYGTGTDGTSTNFAAGSWTGYTVANAGAVAAVQPITTTFTRYAIAAAIPITATQVGIKICYTPVGTAGANDWAEFAAVQLEATSAALAAAVATPFESLPVDVVLARAERYFWAITEPAASISVAPSGQGASTTTCIISIPLPVWMRVAPTAAFAGSALSATTWTVTHVVTNTVLSTPFLAATAGGSTQNELNLTATTGATLTAGQTCTLTGAAGGGTLQASADL